MDRTLQGSAVATPHYGLFVLLSGVKRTLGSNLARFGCGYPRIMGCLCC
ncbi:MAG: hypothetical protein K0A89_11365 [ANME-2 cluster archaeon]|nr:hypothetical protein [ANME-2 cluster archaeon]